MKNLVKRMVIGFALASTVVPLTPQVAKAISVKATVTADNFYGIFHGNEDASTLDYIGRNETGKEGSTGGYNWSAAETWDFEVDKDDYLYITTWDDASIAKAWLGEFEVNGQKLLSSPSDWEYIFNEDNPFTRAGNPVPGVEELSAAIQEGGWTNAEVVGKNGIDPWKKIAGIDSYADWLKTADQGTDMYTIFRTKVSLAETADVSVPEPASALGLLVFGALSATLHRSKQK